jgi:transposase
VFWQVVLAVERSAAAILGWSSWRRWHQAWARYYHYRRRLSRRESRSSAGASEAVAAGAVGTSDQHGAIDLVEVVWQRLQGLLPSGKRGGRPYTYDRRLIVEAIVHQRRTGCAWNELPSDFPPYQTVHTQLRNWQKSGLWDIAWSDELEQGRPSG